MLIETDGLMSPANFSHWYGMATRGVPYSAKWAFIQMLRKGRDNEDLPFTVTEIDGYKFLRAKPGITTTKTTKKK